MEGIEINMSADIATPIPNSVEVQAPDIEAVGDVISNSPGGLMDDLGISEEQALIEVRDELLSLQDEDDLVDEAQDNPITESNDVIEEPIEIDYKESDNRGISTIDVEKDKILDDKKELEPLEIKDHLGEISDNLMDFREEVLAKIEGGSISPETLLWLNMMLMGLYKEEKREERLSILELLIGFVGRFMLEIVPGGEEELERKAGGKSKRPAHGLGELKELFGKRNNLRRSLIENKAA